MAVVVTLAFGCSSPASQAAPAHVDPAPAIAAQMPADDALRVVFVSDLNGSYGSTTYEPEVYAAVDRIVALDPALVIATGDMVAGQRHGLDYAAMWSAFHSVVTEPLAAHGIPLAPTPGNHDGSAYRGFDDERAELVRAFGGAHKPDLHYVDEAGYPRRYAFRAGDALFVSLDATLAEPLEEEQLDWLDRLLGRDDAEVTVVFGHLPIHPLTHGREHEVLGDSALEEILVRHEVDAYVSGHHHAYFPGRHGALRVVGVGCLGTGARRILGTEIASDHSFVVMEIDDGEIRSIEALRAPDFRTPVRRERLPSRIGQVVRDDVDASHRIALE